MYDLYNNNNFPTLHESNKKILGQWSLQFLQARQQPTASKHQGQITHSPIASNNCNIQFKQICCSLYSVFILLH